MSIRHYIQGNRRGRLANRIEREAMKDPFLADALEGYSRQENLDVKRVRDLRKDIRGKAQRRYRLIRNLGIAASFLACLGFGTYFLSHTKQTSVSEHLAQAVYNDESISEEIPVPQQDTLPKTLAYAKKETSRQREVLEDVKMEAEVEAAVLEAEAKIEVEADMVLEAEEELLLEEVIVLETKDVVAFEAEANRMQAAKATPATKPQPIIGKKAYNKYLEEKQIRPTDDNCKNIKGKVVVTFFIDPNGTPHNFTVKKPLCPSADKEAIRLIEEGPKWTTGSEEVMLSVKFP